MKGENCREKEAALPSVRRRTDPGPGRAGPCQLRPHLRDRQPHRRPCPADGYRRVGAARGSDAGLFRARPAGLPYPGQGGGRLSDAGPGPGHGGDGLPRGGVPHRAGAARGHGGRRGGAGAGVGRRPAGLWPRGRGPARLQPAAGPDVQRGIHARPLSDGRRGDAGGIHRLLPLSLIHI